MKVFYKRINYLGIQKDEWFNVTPSIESKIGLNYYMQPSHPLNIIKKSIESYFKGLSDTQFQCIDGLKPIVSTYQAFDSLLIPKDHVSRSSNDTFYINKDTILRPHTSAHQVEFLSKGYDAFTVTGDVYRRDTIDSRHYPVFTQMEAVKLLPGINDSNVVINDLKKTVEGMVQCLFKGVEMRWVEGYFPFTCNSLELEINFDHNWVEVLGCGQIQDQVLKNGHVNDKKGWALGFGLDRLAMILFSIPDIRLLWSQDPRFLSQFKGYDEGINVNVINKHIPHFIPFSKYPSCYKDMSFFLPQGMKQDSFSENTFCEIIREHTNDMVEKIELIDSFHNPKKDKTSLCYRITYRSLDRNLTNEEINVLQDQVRKEVSSIMKVTLR
ncbi:hypothetical protein WA158_000917 [Blastocystis sp. Blastoise]